MRFCRGKYTVVTSAYLAALVCLAASPVVAQTISGIVSGVVTDPTGAAVSGAPVALVDSATGLRRSVNAQANGEFVFQSVQPATYSVIVEAPGFKRFEKT